MSWNEPASTPASSKATPWSSSPCRARLGCWSGDQCGRGPHQGHQVAVSFTRAIVAVGGWSCGAPGMAR